MTICHYLARGSFLPLPRRRAENWPGVSGRRDWQVGTPAARQAAITASLARRVIVLLQGPTGPVRPTGQWGPLGFSGVMPHDRTALLYIIWVAAKQELKLGV